MNLTEVNDTETHIFFFFWSTLSQALLKSCPLSPMSPVNRSVSSPPFKMFTLFRRASRKPNLECGKSVFKYAAYFCMPYHCCFALTIYVLHFVLHSEFAKTIQRPFSLRYNPYTQSVCVLKDMPSINDVVEELRHELDIVGDALCRLSAHIGVWTHYGSYSY